jgi:protein-disulfide isomerase
MSFKALLFVQEKCEPCHRTLKALQDAYDKSDYIEVTDYKDKVGNKTDLARQYGVEVTPTLVVVRPGDSVVNRVQGSQRMPSVFFSKLARTLNAVNNGVEDEA